MTRVQKVVSEKELKQVFSIRLRVFVREQGVPVEIELDRDDRRAAHLLASVQRKPVGTARLVIKNGRAKIGRMAVLKSYRGKGVGKALLKRAIELARKSGAKMIYLHAQLPVVGFYEKMGFRSVGRIFIEAGISHRKMVLVRPTPFLGRIASKTRPSSSPSSVIKNAKAHSSLHQECSRRPLVVVSLPAWLRR
jgi:predicted GNAT family N-acyltransferase